MTYKGIYFKGNQSTDPVWWNQPVLGEDGLLKQVLNSNAKQSIPVAIQDLYCQELNHVVLLAKTAESLHRELFCEPEFLQFAHLQYMKAKGIDNYAELNQSIQWLQVAIEAKDSFIAIDQIELSYRGSKQQSFYHYVEEELKNVDQTSLFREKIHHYLDQVLPEIKTPEGKQALISYVEHLDRLSEHKLGLSLLKQFKMYQFSDYSILRVVSEMIKGLTKHDLINFKKLVETVKNKYQVFEELSRIIEIPANQNSPKTYARIIQNLGLTNRYALSYVTFEQFIDLLQKWSKSYRKLMQIRKHYPSETYQQTKVFCQPILGLSLYQNYKKLAVDPQTKKIYFELE